MFDAFRIAGRIALEGQDDVRNELEDTGNKAEQTSSKLQGAFKKMGNAAIQVGKLIVKGLIAGAGAIGVLTKYSLEAYANYEQLVGGVETLFGAGGKSLEEYAKSVGKSVEEASAEYNKLMASQKAVIENASNAYQTAGLSANQYMETVTSFSASLLQGLGGDTEKAAKVADRAITDMSDNANKMGTSMDMIQNAYQGFAKQNYTMLDNLKLGYGGTAGEMARLINESGVLGDSVTVTAETVNSVSFDKIIEAIGVVQDKIGITGTTAKEAATTIQGSTNAMKAAWGNLLVGLADDTQDFNQLLDNFVNSAVTVVGNILPRIKIIFSGIPKLINGLVPQIPGIVQSILPGLLEGAIALMNGLVGALPEIIQILVDMLPMFIDGVMQIVTGLINNVDQIIIPLITAIPGIVMQLVQKLIENMPVLINGVVKLVNGVVQALPQIVNTIIQYIPRIVNNIVTTLVQGIPVLIQGAIQLLNAIVDAIPQIIPVIVETLPLIINTLVAGLVDALPLLLNGAIQLLMAIIQAIPIIIQMLVPRIPMIVSAIVNTLIANMPTLISGAITLLMGIVDAIPQIALEVLNAVPQIISSLVQGLVNGIGELGKAAGKIGKSILDELMKPINKAKEKVKEVIDKIKGFFNFKFSWPKLSMPHFGITPKGWKIGDLLKGSIPKLGIDWYAKGGIMNAPTAFGYNPSTGKIKVGGEAGGEAIAPIDTLLGYVKSAVAEQNAGLLDTLDNLIAMLAEYLPQLLNKDNQLVLDTGVLVGATAGKMNEELGNIYERNGRGG